MTSPDLTCERGLGGSGSDEEEGDATAVANVRTHRGNAGYGGG